MVAAVLQAAVEPGAHHDGGQDGGMSPLLAGFPAHPLEVGLVLLRRHIALEIGRSIVVAELDDHPVAGLQEVDDLLPAALGDEGAGTAAADGVVLDHETVGVEQGLEVLRPAVHHGIVRIIGLRGRIARDIEAVLAGGRQDCDGGERQEE